MLSYWHLRFFKDLQHDICPFGFIFIIWKAFDISRRQFWGVKLRLRSISLLKGGGPLPSQNTALFIHSNKMAIVYRLVRHVDIWGGSRAGECKVMMSRGRFLLPQPTGLIKNWVFLFFSYCWAHFRVPTMVFIQFPSQSSRKLSEALDFSIIA